MTEGLDVQKLVNMSFGNILGDLPVTTPNRVHCMHRYRGNNHFVIFRIKKFAPE